MRVLFDTSVIIAALIDSHPANPVAAPWLEGVRDGRLEVVISAHTLAETYAGLSRLPVRPRVTGTETVRLLDDNVLPFVEIRGLSARQYLSLVRRLARVGLIGGVVYDAIHAEVARRARVDALVTLNPRHFERVWFGRPEQIVSPLTTPPP